MMILVVDGQGGGLGRLLVRELKGAFPQAEIAAVGTNSTAANAMMKAGADFAATGENAVVVNCRHADIIVGAVGIVIADSMWGEITPRMAQAVGQSDARRVLIPINLCSNLVVGVSEMSMSKLVQAAVDTVRRLTEKK
ncbi:MAG: DUF3842 family protein [Firmicutes bacterium]|jgi:prephenate dehydrogenase|nr:DUF3842 family protein [Bacillota bacterium]MCI5832739.1 DUF3842 family protein [Clostridiales bacterium]